jgi:hypothetical protein
MLNKILSKSYKNRPKVPRHFCAKFPSPIASTFHFSQTHLQTPQKIKRACNPSHSFRSYIVQNITSKYLDLIRRASYNSTYKKLAVQWLNEALCFVSNAVLADSFRLRNRQLLVAAKRYVPYRTTVN